MVLLMLTLAMSGEPIAALAQSAPDSQDLWQRGTLTGDWGGLRSRLVNDGFTFALQQQSELWVNTLGGLSRGGAADGLLTLSLSVDLDKASGWEGGSLFASGFQIEGVGPTTPLNSVRLTTSANSATWKGLRNIVAPGTASNAAVSA